MMASRILGQYPVAPIWSLFQKLMSVGGFLLAAHALPAKDVDDAPRDFVVIVLDAFFAIFFTEVGWG